MIGEKKVAYDMIWDAGTDALNIEFHMIRCGGYVTDINGKHGHGLFYHFKQAQIELWGDLIDHHRWSDLILEEILKNRITCIVGSKDCGKTHCMARFALTDYYPYADETLTLMSSTHGQGLQFRIFGEIKKYHELAKEKRPWLPGNIVESKYGIFTDKLEFGGTIRDQRKAIICVACGKGDEDSIDSLSKFAGAKQRRRRLFGDEFSMMPLSYMSVLANLDKGDFKGIFGGNPLGQGDPLDRFSEPECGWANLPEPTKTTTWDNKLGGRTINLVGTDSPNFNPPCQKPYPYIYLLDPDDEANTRKRYGDDSMQYWSQIKGVRKSGLMAHRILTMEICKKFGAFDECVWAGTPRTKVYALDAAFGGDRAVGGAIEFGTDVSGREVIKSFQPRSIPISVSSDETPEEQLAKAVMTDCIGLGIPAENVFFDAGMRATLATAIARIFSTHCNAINFGAPATDRPVSKDDYVFDEKTKQRRLKKCSEAYSKFVTELAWSCRMVVEARQMREMPEEVVREFELREWMTVSGDRIELESKADTKKRMGKSPDLADWFEIAVEGARRLGFQIEGLKESTAEDSSAKDWLETALSRFRRFTKKSELRYQ